MKNIQEIDFIQGRLGLAELSDLQAHIESLDYERLLTSAFEVLKEEQILDIRVIFYWLISKLRTVNITEVSTVLDDFTAFFADQLAMISPQDNYMKLFKGVYKWSFQTIDEMLQKASPIAITKMEQETLSNAFSHFMEMLKTCFAETQLNFEEDYSILLRKINKIKLKEESVAVDVQHNDIEQRDINQSSSLNHLSNDAMDQGSQKWQILKQKIKLLTELIEKKNHFAAAVVYADVSHILQHFDPREYFPEAFLALYQILNVETLAQILSFTQEQQNTVEWMLLSQQYQMAPELLLTAGNVSSKTILSDNNKMQDTQKNQQISENYNLASAEDADHDFDDLNDF
ncbi:MULTISPECIES: type VI secretion system protein IglI family protein [Cysteiniphilum]|uniref:type VI secretion system protein IglI family protein n=1 Tax=Cysteiniphilum TaxID=2056696 RepID=UPI00177CAB34|nr:MULTISPECIES: type VI secretion system protein IglI family protein [Cysteiniphilum]